MTQRRQFLKSMTAATGATAAFSLFKSAWTEDLYAATSNISHLSPAQAALDEDFWFTIRNMFTVSPNVINLNNGGVSPQPLVVQEAMRRYNSLANEGPAYYMWQVLDAGRINVMKGLAELGGVSHEELVVMRNSTEALETLIFGMDLKPGDEILTSNQDYPHMRFACHQRGIREGFEVREISLPLKPKNLSEITDRYKESISEKTKLIVMCHMINLTGQILPVKDVCDYARSKNIPVIVDGAHTFSHFDFKIPDLGCDYFGTSLHKWLCAPFGTGMMYVKKDKITNVWPHFATDEAADKTMMNKFMSQGTRNFPAELAIGEAVSFNMGIGLKRKEERLRYLKDYWTSRVKEIPNVKFNTNLSAEQSCCIANFTIEGKKPGEIQSFLFDKYKVYTTPIDHAEFTGVRVTPHIYTSLWELDQLVQGIEEFAKS